MIEQSNAAQSLELAEHFENAGVVVTPVPGSPLATITRLSSITIVDANRPEVEVMESSSNNAEHNAAMADAVSMAVGPVAAHLDFARNVATPAIELFTKNLAERAASVETNPYFNIKISEVGIPTLLQDTDLMQTIENHNTGTTLMPQDALRYSNAETDQLRDMMHIGASGVDGLIDTWLASLPEGFVQTVWQSIFQNKAMYAPTARVEAPDTLLKDPFNGADACLITFLLAQKLPDEQALEVDLPLVELRDRLQQLRFIAATWLVRHKDMAASYKATGTIIHARRQNELVVDREVYAEYLEAGGRIEVLMGSLVGGKRWTTATDLAANAEEAVQLWANYTMANQARQDMEAAAAIKSAAKLVFEQGLLSEQIDAEKEMLSKPGVIEGMIQAFADEMDNLSMPDTLAMECFWKIMCKVRFGYTPSLQILENIDYYTKQGMTLEQAASQALFLYVNAYVLGMLEVKSTSASR